MTNSCGGTRREDFRFLGPEYEGWVERLAAASAAALSWPGESEMRKALDDFAIQPVDQEPAIAATGALQRGPLRWILSHLVGSIRETFGDEQGGHIDLPALPESLGDAGRCLPIHAYLLALPHATAYHRSLGIAPAITRDTFRDVGRHVDRHRLMFGTTGVAGAGFLLSHFRGLLFECGRLQYQPARFQRRAVDTEDPRLVEMARRVREEGGPDLGEPVLSVHIPEAGPLLPDAVERSLARVVVEVADRLPGSRRRFAVCFSWLLDEQLAEYLPDTSNIVRFQRRFHLVPDWWADGDHDTLRFVFRRPSTPPEVFDELPQRTTLERAVVAHLRAGQHWRLRAGWLRLD